MPSRYSNTQIVKDENGKRKFSTLIIPSIPFSKKDIYIKTTSVMRLDVLAHQFYKDAKLWWIIANSNGISKGTLFVPNGTRLRIPPANNIQDLIDQTNKSR